MMRISARAEYGLRAMLVMASEGEGEPVACSTIAHRQAMPTRFVESTLVKLRRSGLVTSRRGTRGGFLLGRPANTITVAAVVQAIDGPLAVIHGLPPEEICYLPPAEHLRTVWLATQASIRAVLESVTIADLAHGRLPQLQEFLLDDPPLPPPSRVLEAR